MRPIIGEVSPVSTLESWVRPSINEPNIEKTAVITGSSATGSETSPDQDWRQNATLEALVVATKEPREGRPPEGRVNDFTLWNVAHSDTLPEARAARITLFQEASQSLLDNHVPGRAADYLR